MNSPLAFYNSFSSNDCSSSIISSWPTTNGVPIVEFKIGSFSLGCSGVRIGVDSTSITTAFVGD
tara:strand:- start:756 stop:947 length:192 start_codon:yes stop_codon:yes gene_type:complete